MICPHCVAIALALAAPMGLTVWRKFKERKDASRS